MVLLFVILFVIASFYFIPIMMLRNRIKAEVQKQLRELAETMQSLSTPEDKLLIRQMYLESRPQWPLATEVQKVIVFGLLPPLAWIMAAVVENLLY